MHNYLMFDFDDLAIPVSKFSPHFISLLPPLYFIKSSVDAVHRTVTCASRNAWELSLMVQSDMLAHLEVAGIAEVA